MKTGIDPVLVRQLSRPLRVLHEQHRAGGGNHFLLETFERAIGYIPIASPVVGVDNHHRAPRLHTRTRTMRRNLVSYRLRHALSECIGSDPFLGGGMDWAFFSERRKNLLSRCICSPR